MKIYRKNFCKYGHDLSIHRYIRYVKGKKRSECRLCRNNRIRKKNSEYNIDKEKFKKSKKRYYMSDKGKAQSRRQNLKKFFSITVQEYDKLNKIQNNLCKICLQPETKINYRTGKINRLSIDHCHKTRKIRGLLCVTCNMGLGHFKDNPLLLQRALDYLKGN